MRGPFLNNTPSGFKKIELFPILKFELSTQNLGHQVDYFKESIICPCDYNCVILIEKSKEEQNQRAKHRNIDFSFIFFYCVSSV